MALVITANTGANTLIISASLWAAMANVAGIQYGSGGNTNIGLVASQMIASGLRDSSDRLLNHGERTTAGLTVSYIENNVKANSE